MLGAAFAVAAQPLTDNPFDRFAIEPFGANRGAGGRVAPDER
jgi:hypothetical protein